MSNNSYSHQELEKIMSIEGNNNCVDCNQEKPQWASINNSVFLCLQCAGVHRNLGVSISYVRSLMMDDWDEKQLKMLYLGGNNRFKDNFNDFNIDISNLSIEVKYLLKASDFYRRKLNAELNNEILPATPSNDEARQKIEQDELPTIEEINQNTEKPKESTGFMGRFSGFMSSASSKIKETAYDVKDKLNKIEVKEALKSGGEKTYQFAKESGSYIAEKSKQAYVNK